MTRSPEYTQAYRAAIKDAVTFLHDEAKRMNDPKAKGILNDAAFHMGVHFARNRPTPSEAYGQGEKT